MAGQNVSEKILATGAGKDSVHPGESVEAKVHVCMMHDVTSDKAIDVVRDDFGGKVAEGLKIVVTPDHYVPNKDIKSAKLYQKLKAFVEEQTAAEGYTSASEYIRELIRAARNRRTRVHRLETLLLEGLESGDCLEADEAYWNSKQRKLRQRWGDLDED